MNRIILAGIAVIGVITLLMIMIHSRVRTDTTKIDLPKIEDFPESYWTALADKKIFFGHKSVGNNIIDGIKDITSKYNYIRLNIVDTIDPTAFDQPVFAHAGVGKNRNPSSKINDFQSIMDSGIGSKVDIAFFKFCYVDIGRDSKPESIFEEYNGMMNELAEQYPATAFLHVTVPISSVSNNFKRIVKFFIKQLIGKTGMLEDNIKREQYNTLLKNTCAKQNIFDLALVETVNSDNLKCFVSKGGRKVYVMASEYTNDGGHLNKQGRKRVAEQFLITLASIANKN